MFNVLSIAVGVLYIALGIYIIVLKKFFYVNLEGVIPYFLGGLLMAYGIFRIYRAIYTMKNQDEN